MSGKTREESMQELVSVLDEYLDVFGDPEVLRVAPFSEYALADLMDILQSEWLPYICAKLLRMQKVEPMVFEAGGLSFSHALSHISEHASRVRTLREEDVNEIKNILAWCYVALIDEEWTTQASPVYELACRRRLGDLGGYRKLCAKAFGVYEFEIPLIERVLLAFLRHNGALPFNGSLRSVAGLMAP